MSAFKYNKDQLFGDALSHGWTFGYWDDEHVSDVALLAANDERERALWGDHLADKRVLQRRGFGVWWVEHGKTINVGERVVSVRKFKQMAARHRRLSGIK